MKTNENSGLSQPDPGLTDLFCSLWSRTWFASSFTYHFPVDLVPSFAHNMAVKATANPVCGPLTHALAQAGIGQQSDRQDQQKTKATSVSYNRPPFYNKKHSATRGAWEKQG